MESVSQMASILSQVLESEANQLARETGWQQRERKRETEQISSRRCSLAGGKSQTSVWMG